MQFPGHCRFRLFRRRQNGCYYCLRPIGVFPGSISASIQQADWLSMECCKQWSQRQSCWSSILALVCSRGKYCPYSSLPRRSILSRNYVMLLSHIGISWSMFVLQMALHCHWNLLCPDIWRAWALRPLKLKILNVAAWNAALLIYKLNTTLADCYLLRPLLHCQFCFYAGWMLRRSRRQAFISLSSASGCMWFNWCACISFCPYCYAFCIAFRLIWLWCVPCLLICDFFNYGWHSTFSELLWPSSSYSPRT